MSADQPTGYEDVLDHGDETLSHIAAQVAGAYGFIQAPPGFLNRTAASLLTPSPALGMPARGHQAFGFRGLAPVVGISLGLVFVLGAVGYTANSFIHVFPPEKQLPPPAVVFVSNSPPPLSDQRFRPLDPVVAHTQSGLPVAYLTQVPSGLRGTVGTEVFLPQAVPQGLSQSWTERILSLVRYTGKRNLLVGLFRLAQWIHTRPVLLGERTVRLVGGQKAWLSVSAGDSHPYWLTIVKGGYLVTLYGPRGLPELKQAASSINILPKTSNAVSRIPRNWPAPGPAGTRPKGVDMAVIGGAAINWSSPRPELHYYLTYGDRGTTDENGLRFTLQLPKGVSFEGRTAQRNHVVHTGDGNGLVGGSLAVTVTTRPFRPVLVVNSVWHVGARIGRRNFYFRIMGGQKPPASPISKWH